MSVLLECLHRDLEECDYVMGEKSDILGKKCFSLPLKFDSAVKGVLEVQTCDY